MDNLELYSNLTDEVLLGLLGIPLKDKMPSLMDMEKIDISEENHLNLERLISGVRAKSKKRMQITRRLISAIAHDKNDCSPNYYRIHPNLKLLNDPHNNAILNHINQKALELEKEILHITIHNNLEELKVKRMSLMSYLRIQITKSPYQFSLTS